MDSTDTYGLYKQIHFNNLMAKCKAIYPKSMSEEYGSELERRLLSIDPRFVVYRSFSESEQTFVGSDGITRRFIDDCFFIPTKEIVYWPYLNPRLSHQIAHMLEMTDETRQIKVDWGLRNCSKFKSPEGLIIATAREVRVRAIENHICAKKSMVFDEKENRWIKANLFRLTENKNWMTLLEDILPYGRFKTMQDVKDWINTISETTYKEWNINRIDETWKKRVDVLRNWMES